MRLLSLAKDRRWNSVAPLAAQRHDLFMEEPSFEPLTDGTVVLQRPAESDAERVTETIRASYQHLTPWMAWAKPDHQVEDTLRWIQRTDDPASHPFMILDPDEHYVGSAGLSSIDARNLIVNVGYWLAPDATGFGYATRATNLLIRYAIEQVGMERAEVWMSVENQPSQQVAERSIATYEATLRQCLRYEGRNHDAHCYSYVRGDPID